MMVHVMLCHVLWCGGCQWCVDILWVAPIVNLWIAGESWMVNNQSASRLTSPMGVAGCLRLGVRRGSGRFGI